MTLSSRSLKNEQASGIGSGSFIVGFRFLFVVIGNLCLSNVVMGQGTPPVVKGRVSGISVGPQGSTWLTTRSGGIYYTQGMDSLWSSISLTDPGEHEGSLANVLDRVLFFSTDTAIIFGNIRCSHENPSRRCLYRTINGGLSWHKVTFGDKGAWVRDGQILGAGKACISASDGRLHMTYDHGASWQVLPKLFTREPKAYYPSPDLWSFHYANNNTAIATNRSNHIVVTSTNFLKQTRIPSPLDQGLFDRRFEPYYLNGTGRKFVANWNIDKVRIFGAYYLVMQNGRMYVTERDTVQWREMEPAVHDFELDAVSGRLYVVSVDQGVGEIDTGLQYRPWNLVGPDRKPQSMRVWDDKVFLLYPSFLDAQGRDVVRGSIGNLTITETNVRSISGYTVFQVSEEGAKLIVIASE